MSGANYNVSVTQVMKSEKKLRILSVMKLITDSNKEIAVRDFIAGCLAEVDGNETEHKCNDNLTAFASVLTECDDVCRTASYLR